MITITCTRIMDAHKKQSFFIFVRTSPRWVKRPGGLNRYFLTPSLLIGVLRATPAELASGSISVKLWGRIDAEVIAV